MICYRDRTYCRPETCIGKCGREFTDEDRKAAIKWWGGKDDFPLAVSDFCEVHRKDVEIALLKKEVEELKEYKFMYESCNK